MSKKDLLVVLDFDGFLINSYGLLSSTFEHFGLDVGDLDRFKSRRKFLKYVGGGKEFLGNLVKYTLPKRKKVREVLTEKYVEEGKIYSVFVPIINQLIENPRCHIGVVSRNYTLNPGNTIRATLRNSGITEQDLDFVIPIPVGVKKRDVLEAMKSARYQQSLLGGDEVGDFRAAVDAGYEAIIASYGFDDKKRLIKVGNVPKNIIFETPKLLVRALSKKLKH